jgi:hypothetical protein
MRCDVARPDDDDEAIRALLRSTAMGDDMAVSMTREPDAFAADAIMGDRTHTTVLRDAAGEVLGVGSRHVRERYVNGCLARVGYLGALRRDERVARRARLLPMCYDHLLQTHEHDEADFDLTSIVDDNTAAKRLLERGLPGMPKYTKYAPWLTLLIPTTRRARAIDAARQDDMPQVAALLQSTYRNYQLSPRWRVEDLPPSPRTLGLSVDDMAVVRERHRIAGCAAVWDQRDMRQVVVSRYAPTINRWRGLINIGASLTGQSGLPAPGSAMRLGYLSHWAVEPGNGAMLRDLIDACRLRAHMKGLHWLAMGISPDHPLLGTVCKAVRPRIYRSTLYLVHGPDTMPLRVLDARLPHVEVATL